MAIHVDLRATQTALLEAARRNSLLLIHPKTQYRRLLLANLLMDESFQSFYYALQAEDKHLKTFINNLSSALGLEAAQFGKTIKGLSPAVYTEPNTNLVPIVESLAQDLGELSEEPYWLILDEFDLGDAGDELQPFIEVLLDHLPADVHLLLNSRRLPRLSWLVLLAKKQAALFLDEQLLEENFYERNPQPGRFDLEVFGFGEAYANFQGERIQNWEGSLPRLLLFFALDKVAVHRSEICRTFWPDSEHDDAVNSFHVTKRRLHRALGADILFHQDLVYWLDPSVALYYDVIDFVETILKARHQQSITLWQQVIQLYRGPFLQGQDSPWIMEHRLAFHTAYLEAINAMSSYGLVQGRQEDTLKFYLKILNEDFQREEIHRELLRLYSDLGRRKDALAHFQDLEKRFKKAGLKLSETTLKLSQNL